MSKLAKPTIQRCRDLDEVRQAVDALDAQIIPLLCERIQYIVQAAAFKETASDVRIYGRIEAIITRAKAYANAMGVSEDYIESVYRHLIDESIRQEKAVWLATQATQAAQTQPTDNHSG
ncbi:chorismate mutase [Ostreibacterium oceani]|uniref:chorismate mutase n=1 Tax=Ostreibacterium oceani TaxID=2654998 RepID=A0A6N7F008_9GAMM|nr:chorismate mutase [Ostreibacterium oceani]MPV86959.1 chorismate mutase [Ostreibacterium oceani]